MNPTITVILGVIALGIVGLILRRELKRRKEKKGGK